MTTRAQVPIGRIVWALIRNQPARYGVSSVIWITLWVMPVLAGFIAAAFFDSLTADTNWDISLLIALLWGYVVARIALVFSGMRLQSELLFRASAGMRAAMLRWIFSLPGARPVEETPGEIVSRVRDDVEHTIEAMDFTVDVAGSIVSAVVSIVVLYFIDPVITAVCSLRYWSSS